MLRFTELNFALEMFQHKQLYFFIRNCINSVLVIDHISNVRKWYTNPLFKNISYNINLILEQRPDNFLGPLVAAVALMYIFEDKILGKIYSRTSLPQKHFARP